MRSKIISAILCICMAPVLLQGESSSALYTKGARLAASGRLDEALEVFKKVIKVSPYYCLGHYGLGKVYLYKYGMLDQSIKHLRKAVTYDRKFAKGHFYLGMAYFLAKKYPRAISAFYVAYKTDESMIEALYNIGIIYDIMENSFKSKYYMRRYKNAKLREEEDIIF